MEAACWTVKVVVGSHSWTDAPSLVDTFSAGQMSLCQTAVGFAEQ